MINKTYVDFVRKSTVPSQKGNLDLQTAYLMIEAAELANEVKRIHTKDGGRASKERWSKMIEELGDTLFYVFLIAETLGVSIDHVMIANMEKLEKRRYTNADPNRVPASYTPVPDVPKKPYPPDDLPG